MLTRKKRRRFNALIVKKTDILASIILICIISVLIILGTTNFKLFNKQLQVFLNSQIPMIHTSHETDGISPKKDFDVLAIRSVLAEAFPMISSEIDNDDETQNSIKEYDDTEKDKSTDKKIIPENTFPIIDTKNISKNLSIKNETTYQPDINMLVDSPLNFNSPEILIVHTHASESYSMSENNYYLENDIDRTTDTSYNVVRVGDELAKELINYGFKVTHAREINDYPSYNQSYKKTLEVINNYLINNPNIQIVLDIHRDAVVKNDGTKYKFTAEINGENTAQIMIVCGTNQAGLPNDTWQENLKFALKLQKYMENNYPGLARPLNLRQERFNTHATLGSMIIEVGTSGNTLDEALNSTKYLAKTIKEVLKPYG